MAWMLIAWLYGGHGGANTTYHFRDEQQCHQAASLMKQAYEIKRVICVKTEYWESK
jgi:hypothetical protein